MVVSVCSQPQMYCSDSTAGLVSCLQFLVFVLRYVICSDSDLVCSSELRHRRHNRELINRTIVVLQTVTLLCV